MFQQAVFYTTKQMEDNKSLVEKQNFSIASGIPGGKAAEEEVWANPFLRKHPLAQWNQSFDISNSAEQLRRSSVPFGMNSPTNNSSLSTTKGLFSTFRSGSSGMSPLNQDR